MDDNRKRTLILAAVFSVVGLAYFGYTQYFGDNDAPEQPGPSRPAQAADADTGDDEPGQAMSPEERQALRRTATIETEHFRATIDNLGGGVSKFLLLGDERFRDTNGYPKNLVIRNVREENEALRIELARLRLPADLIWEIEQVSPREVRLAYDGQGVRVERTLSAGRSPYQIWQRVRVTNNRERDLRTRLEVQVARWVTRENESGGGISFLGGSRSPEITNGICVYEDGEVVRKPRDELAPEDDTAVPHGYGANNVHLAAVESTYFVLAAASAGREDAARCGMWGSNLGSGDEEGTLFRSRLVYRWDTIEPGATREWSTLGYIGPKDPETLAAAGHDLPEVLDLGWFALIASRLADLLSLIHGVLPEPIQNWGLAIILLTLLVRLVLFPLTNLSFGSMARMRMLKPEIDRVNELYKDDAEKKGAAIMELYRKNKINPLFGCLPMVLQLPIWWALYTSLSTNIELYHMPFMLFWQDLSGRDPYFILPLVLGALMHLQQRITPTTMDPTQAKMMMWFMPVMITVFMLFLPAGLCLYMMTNSILGIGQQKLNEWRLSRAATIPVAPAADSKGAASASSGSSDEDDDGTGEGDSDGTEGSPQDAKRRPRRKRIKRTRRG
jgi:YidC/Oxa1 family membrane protein insertase